MVNLPVLRVEVEAARVAASDLYFRLLDFADSTLKRDGGQVFFPELRELITCSVAVNRLMNRVLDEFDDQLEEEKEKYE
ncbi:hypothetical protein HHJ81_03590 [Mobiluncus mulieris]|uniref:hypothetical protein n=1 Tax=Mobiluncus mulieris TaxID=2052 RepID=UPI0014703B2A|nr:hypothetical protein [Mobiluncus mulieris]MCU9995394.1 hypothetical protein [Mobiluncus mulieris]NMW60186.1 hypothetical protein [Mobiluncus mulieris]